MKDKLHSRGLHTLRCFQRNEFSSADAKGKVRGMMCLRLRHSHAVVSGIRRVGIVTAGISNVDREFRSGCPVARQANPLLNSSIGHTYGPREERIAACFAETVGASSRTGIVGCPWGRGWRGCHGVCVSRRRSRRSTRRCHARRPRVSRRKRYFGVRSGVLVRVAVTVGLVVLVGVRVEVGVAVVIAIRVDDGMHKSADLSMRRCPLILMRGCIPTVRVEYGAGVGRHRRLVVPVPLVCRLGRRDYTVGRGHGAVWCSPY